MNQQKEEMIRSKRNESMQLVRLGNRKVNELRGSPGHGESPAHFNTKKKIFEKLRSEGKHVITEAIFKTGGRADIFVLDDFRVIEVVKTETEESIKNKHATYPAGLKIEVIRC